MDTISNAHRQALESMRFPNSYAFMNHLKDDDKVNTLLQQVGVTKAELMEENGSISGLPFKTLLDLNIAAHDSPVPYSLNVTQEFNIATHGMLGLAIAASKQLEEAIKLAIQYVPLINPAVDIVFNPRDTGAAIVMTCHDAFDQAAPTMTEISLMVLNQFLMQTQAQVTPDAVEFSHPTPFARHYYEAYFRCPVYFEREHTQMTISHAGLQSPMAFYNELTTNILHDYLDDALDRFTHTRHPWTVEVRNYLSAHLADPQHTSKVATAQYLNVTPRSLTRKLTQEDTTFQTVLESVKLTAAKQSLLHTHKAISSIAYDTGFNDPQTFSRAFKRWTGQSPRDFRMQSR